MPTNLKLEQSRSIVSSTSTLFHETENLVSVHNHQAVTTSINVSEYFGKRHCDVLRSISMIECSHEFSLRNFAYANYKDAQGKSRPMYYLTRDGCTLLAMGFTGKVAARFKEAYINAFNEMEEKLHKQEYTQYAEKLLQKKVTAFCKKMRSLKRNTNYMPFDCLYPSICYLEGETFERNLDNVFAQVNNAYLSGMNAAAQYFKTKKELEELKRFLSKLSDEIHNRMGY